MTMTPLWAGCAPLALAMLIGGGQAAQADADCAPLFAAYAAQQRVPALRKTVTVPDMPNPVEMVLTPETLYSRTSPTDPWSKIPLDAETRAMMAKGYPTPDTITDCHSIGAQMLDGVAATGYEFTPGAASGNAPGEKLTVLIGDASGLPLSETAAKAGTRALMVYDGVTAPAP